MIELSPLALQNAPLLRAIAAGPHASLTILANAAGVGVSNLNRKLNSLAAEGLIEQTGATSCQVELTEAGAAAIAGLDKLENPPAAERSTLPLSLIVQSDFNPRTDFDTSTLWDLADSIAVVGVLQPIVVRPKGEVFELVIGERRYRAAVIARERDMIPADWEIPVKIKALDDVAALEVAGVENLQREDMHWLDEAAFYRKLADAGRSARQIEDLCGKSGRKKRSIQELIKFDREMTDEDRALARLPEGRRDRLKIEDIRFKLSIRKPVDPTPLEAAIGSAEPVEGPSGSLSTAAILLLIEVAHRSGAEKAEWIEVRETIALDPNARQLIAADYLAFDRTFDVRQVALAPKAIEFLGSRFTRDADGSFAIDAVTLQWGQAETGLEAVGGYTTPWLRPAPAAATPPETPAEQPEPAHAVRGEFISLEPLEHFEFKNPLKGWTAIPIAFIKLAIRPDGRWTSTSGLNFPTWGQQSPLGWMPHRPDEDAFDDRAAAMSDAVNDAIERTEREKNHTLARKVVAWLRQVERGEVEAKQPEPEPAEEPRAEPRDDFARQVRAVAEEAAAEPTEPARPEIDFAPALAELFHGVEIRLAAERDGRPQAWKLAEYAVRALVDGDMPLLISTMVRLETRMGDKAASEFRSALHRAGFDFKTMRRKLDADSPDWAETHEGLEGAGMVKAESKGQYLGWITDRLLSAHKIHQADVAEVAELIADRELGFTGAEFGDNNANVDWTENEAWHLADEGVDSLNEDERLSADGRLIGGEA